MRRAPLRIESKLYSLEESCSAGLITHAGCDALGRATSVTNPWRTADQAITRMIFDPAGRVTSTVAALGITNVFGDDAAGRRTSVTSRSPVLAFRFALALLACGQ
jgi:YD repeat-containing protein